MKELTHTNQLKPGDVLRFKSNPYRQNTENDGRVVEILDPNGVVFVHIEFPDSPSRVGKTETAPHWTSLNCWVLDEGYRNRMKMRRALGL